MRRAFGLSRAVAAELFLLQVEPWRERYDPLQRATHLFWDLRERLADEPAVQELRRFTDRVLPSGFPAERAMVRCGNLCERTAELALALAVDLIVMARRDELRMQIAVGLAQRTGIPVWVANEVGRRGPVLAATDLRDDCGAVLSTGIEYARHLGEQVIFMHNVPLVTRAVAEDGAAVIIEPTAGRLAAQAARLVDAARRLEAEPECMVVSRAANDDAVIEVARRYKAEVIALGARYSHRVSSRAGLADRVIARSRSSALLVPCGRNSIQRSTSAS